MKRCGVIAHPIPRDHERYLAHLDIFRVAQDSSMQSDIGLDKGLGLDKDLDRRFR